MSDRAGIGGRPKVRVDAYGLSFDSTTNAARALGMTVQALRYAIRQPVGSRAQQNLEYRFNKLKERMEKE